MARTKCTLPTTSQGAAYRIIHASQARLRATSAAATALNPPIVTTAARGGGQRAAAGYVRAPSSAATAATALNPPVVTTAARGGDNVPQPLPPLEEGDNVLGPDMYAPPLLPSPPPQPSIPPL